MKPEDLTFYNQIHIDPERRKDRIVKYVVYKNHYWFVFFPYRKGHFGDLYLFDSKTREGLKKHKQIKNNKLILRLFYLAILDNNFPMKGYSKSRKITNKLELKFARILFEKLDLKQIIKSSGSSCLVD